jgi:hypothetical protein
MEITVRVGEDKSNSNNLRGIAKMGFGEKKRSEEICLPASLTEILPLENNEKSGRHHLPQVQEYPDRYFL